MSTGGPGFAGANAFQNLEAVEIRKHEVEDDEVVIGSGCQVECSGSVWERDQRRNPRLAGLCVRKSAIRFSSSTTRIRIGLIVTGVGKRRECHPVSGVHTGFLRMEMRPLNVWKEISGPPPLMVP